MRFYRVPLEGGGAPELIASFPKVASARCDLSGPCSISVVFGTGRIVSVLDVENKQIGPEIFRTLPNSSGNTPARSRDGVWAYPAQTDKGPVIHLHTATGAFLRTVSVGGVAQLSSLDWAADGSGWFCGSRNRELYFVDRSGKAKLVDSQASSFNPLWAIPSPDGRRLAMLTTISDQNFWSIENF